MASTPNPLAGPLPGVDGQQDPAVLAQLQAGVAQQPPVPAETTNAPITGELTPPPEQQPVSLASPAQQPPPRPPGTSSLGQYQGTKGEIFRNMLGDFLYSAGKGLAEAGHGPEANFRGAGAGITALHDRDVMNQQLEIQRQQAQGMAAYHQAQATALQGGAQTVQVPVYGPDGKVATNPDGSIQTQPIQQKDMGRYFGQTGAANIKGAASTTNTQLTAANRLEVEKAKAFIQAGQVSKIVPVNGPDGKPAMEMINKAGKSLGFLDGAIPPPGLLGTSSTRQQLVQDANTGEWNVVNLSSTTQKNIPGGTAPTPAAGGGNKVRPLAGPNGPLGTPAGQKWVSWQEEDGHTAAGPLSEAKMAGAKNPAQVPMEEVRNISDARQVVNILQKKGDPKGDPSSWGVLQLADSLEKDGKMGVFVSKFNNFMTKKIGASPDDDPRIVTLLDKSQLATTLTMKAHFGASGGRSPQMLEHFVNLANAGTMDGPTFKAGMKAINDYMGDKAMIPKGSNLVGGVSKGDAVQSLIDKYKPK